MTGIGYHVKKITVIFAQNNDNFFFYNYDYGN